MKFVCTGSFLAGCLVCLGLMWALTGIPGMAEADSGSCASKVDITKDADARCRIRIKTQYQARHWLMNEVSKVDDYSVRLKMSRRAYDGAAQ